MPLHFTVRGVPPVSLWRGSYAPLSLMTLLLLQGLVAWILKRIYPGRTSAMGFDWQHCTLLPVVALALNCSHIPSSGRTCGGVSLDPEDDILWERLPHGIWPATLHPTFVYGGRFGSPSSLSHGGSSVLPFGPTHGSSLFSSSPVGVTGAMGSVGSYKLPLSQYTWIG
jgi:hypothetical protein